MTEATRRHAGADPLTPTALRLLVSLGLVLGLLVGAAVYLPRVGGTRSVVAQHTPRFPAGPTGTGETPDGP
ncbi:MAG: hypothetical protein R2704_03415 [Microthrixaceae bacterium]|nr:hypothetical protein [Microthrixaceae bacterium]